MKTRNNGFTLLEVMIALTIMTVAFAAILQSQSGSIIRTTRNKEITIAGWMAHDKMAESEHLLEGKPFSELDKEKEEAFAKPFERYKWKREIKEVEFPDFTMPGKDGDAMPEPVRILGQVITKFLKESIREMTVTVSWDRGKGAQKISVSTYLINLDAEFSFTP